MDLFNGRKLANAYVQIDTFFGYFDMSLHYEKVDGTLGVMQMDEQGKICLGQPFMKQDGEFVQISGEKGLMS